MLDQRWKIYGMVALFLEIIQSIFAKMWNN